MKFYYSHQTHWVTSNRNAVIATVPGSFQSELGCPGDWQPDCLRSWLQDPEEDGVYTFATSSLPAGNYEAKVAINESWDENYGAGGVQNGPNIPFSVEAGNTVTFSYDAFTHVLTVTTSGAPPQPGSVTIPGSFQSELGCPGDWQPECALTHLAFDTDDAVWQGTFNVPAGDWEYKATLDDSWDENYGLNATRNGPNIPLGLAAPSAVKFYYSHQTHWVTSNRNAVIATVPGSFQSELGCPGDWQPDCLRSWLQDPDGDGLYTFVALALPAGSYEAKVAINEGWDENYGVGGAPNGPNIPFTVSAVSPVTFSYDAASHVLTISATAENQPPTATFSAPASVLEGSSFTLTLTDPVDSPADRAARLTYAFDCGDGIGYGSFGSDNSASFPTSEAGTRAVGGKVRDQHGAESEYTATVVVLSPQQGLQELTDMVDALAGSGALSAGEAQSLSAKLRVAGQKLEQGNGQAAANQLRAFINQVNALVRSGRLSESDGASLIAYANGLIASING